MGSKIMIRLMKPCVWFLNKLIYLLDFVCSFLEMHLVKIVAFSIMILCCTMVNALHFVVVIMLVLCLLFGISALRVSFTFIGIFLGFLFLGNMVYQTKIIPEIHATLNCSRMNATVNVTLKSTILDPEWWGFVHLGPRDTVSSVFKGYVFVFIVLTFQTVIKTRQKIARIDAGEPPEVPHVLFLETTRSDADRSLKDCLKFLINYGFYKFGVEITLGYCAFLIAFRMDVFSVLYAIWIAVLFLPDRMTLSMIWPFFMTTLIFSILWQYAMAVGISPKACFEYPWANHTKLCRWVFLPSFTVPPNTKKTLADFALLLLIQRQQSVFDIEKRYGDRYLGGSNKEIYRSPDMVNPTPDHTGNIRSWLDVGKFLCLRCLFRINLAFNFWNGASNADIMSLGFLVGAFVFLWIDYDLCLWNIKKILKWWNVLLGYAVFVILLKSILEFAGCVYANFFASHAVWIIELMFLHCSTVTKEEATFLTQKSHSVYWDALCFSLALLQRRYFQSFYFLHEVDDVIAVHLLQAKGAKLMDELHENKLREFQLKEAKTLNKIKKNMKRIKDWQKRMQGLNYIEPLDHKTAIYMGDYFMFEDLDDMATNLEESSSSSEEESSYEGRPSRASVKNPTVSEFIGTVIKRSGEESGGRLRRDDRNNSDESDEEKKRRRKGSAGKKKKETIKITDEDKLPVKRTKSQQQIEEEVEEKDKMKRAWKLFRTFLDSVVVSMIRFFNANSKDYRYIESKMKAERKIHKKSKGYYSRANLRGQEKQTNAIETSGFEDRRYSDRSQDSRDDELDDSFKKSSQALIVILINAIAMFIMSQTELLCYMIIFLHTVLSPTLISLPLPFLVFMWGSLTSIRPTTTFWTTLIAYTEVTVVIKALFQNSIFPWNSVKGRYTIRPEYPPLFLGIHRDNQFVVADLFLLLLLFLHRYKLKTLGLWNRTHEEETLLPQNLKVYRELPSENTLKELKGNRSLVFQKRKLNSEMGDEDESVARYPQMARWKCTSRATAKLIVWGNKVRTRIRVKEIEGPILVTHEGRRLEPTMSYVTQASDDLLEGNVVLRVYSNDVVIDTKSLIYRLSWVQHFTSLRKFFLQILVRDWRVSSDFYTLMFVFEFLNFLIVFFGYTSFMESEIAADDNFSLAESQIPYMYLFTMISHFMVIVVDRILYLRKNVIGKMILQFLLVIMVHAWMFIVVPIVTDSAFNKLHVPQTYYIISCFYFLMSAYQLRVGYPMRVQGHFLCKKYGYVNYYAYKGLQLIPFFNQLRIILDFICIQSSLSMMEWIRMESIFQLVYENKCSRRADIDYPAARGEEYPKCSKYPIGILVFIGIIVVIWLPFIIFALFNTVAQPNLPQEASLTLRIGDFGKIYETEAAYSDIVSFHPSQFRSFQSVYKDSKKVWSFLSLFDYRDLAVLKFRFDPSKPWIVTTQDLQTLNDTIQNLDLPVQVYLTWYVHRIPRSQIVANAKGHKIVILTSHDEARHQLAKAMIDGQTEVRLNNILPKFMYVTNEGDARPVAGFLSPLSNTYRNITLRLVTASGNIWWKMVELADDAQEEERINKLPYQTSKKMTIYTFNEKNIPKLLINVSKKGIIGLYLSIVLVTWTFIRRLMWTYPYIMFSEMPNPDPVLQLCQDIYLARENQEFALEEDLFAKLLFLFRSPETMIKVTRLTELNPV